MAADIIPPSEIQSELTRIWESLEGTNKTLASSFNLIFFTKNRARAEYIEKIAQSVIEKFPSRIILIAADPESNEDYLNTRVSVLISSKGDSDIACDFIEIDVAGKLQERVPFVILPHIIPDLPIYVIWAEDPSEPSPLFTELQKLATRMIFDSEGTDNLPLFAKSLLNLEQTYRFQIADLTWARCENWRKLLASTFYSPDRLNALKQCSNIQIRYNSKESPYTRHSQSQALYVQGWLATQLEWRLEKKEMKNGEIRLSYKREGGKVDVTLCPEASQNLKPGSLLSIELETANKSRFSFVRDLNIPYRVDMRFSTLEKCDIPLQFLFPKDESGQSLVREICHKGTSAHYLALLNQIKRSFA